MCLSVRDGRGCGRNEFAGRVQNHHVRFSFHRNGHILIFHGDSKRESCWQVWTLWVAGYTKDAIVGACHRTIDGQEHKISWRAGPEQDKIFHLRVKSILNSSQRIPRENQDIYNIYTIYNTSATCH